MKWDAYKYMESNKNKTIKRLSNQIQMMWQGLDEGISVDEMKKRIWPNEYEEE